MSGCARASPTSPITIATPTATEPRAALLRVDHAPSGQSVSDLRRGTRIAPRVLSHDGRAVRACLVPTQAGPLGGDHDQVSIAVGAGATLIVTPIGAAYALPGRLPTVLELEVELDDGARIVFEDAPLILARGADVTRSMTVRLGAGAIAALRDIVVLGDEGRGATDVRLNSTLRVTDPAGTLLHDALHIDPALARDDEHVALHPGHRVVGTLCLFGASPSARDPAALQLARNGTLRRATAPGLAAVHIDLSETWSHWTASAASATEA